MQAKVQLPTFSLGGPQRCPAGRLQSFNPVAFNLAEHQHLLGSFSKTPGPAYPGLNVGPLGAQRIPGDTDAGGRQGLLLASLRGRAEMPSPLDTPLLHRGGAYVTEGWMKQVGAKLAFTSCLSHPLSLSLKRQSSDTVGN